MTNVGATSAETVPVRVLLVEDETLVAEVTAAALTSCGVQVIGRAYDGRRAVELTATLKPDVVVMDVQMPELDGIAAAREIQARCPTPVVMLTVHAEQATALEAAEAGAGAFVVKPGTPDELLRAIIVSMARFADLQQLRRVNAELREALDTVKTLSGYLPICAHCKKIRDGEGAWHPIESYISDHSQARFSHGLCPSCIPKYFPGEAKAPQQT
ncbi:MAG: response regulator [Acidobacteriota bacterium]